MASTLVNRMLWGAALGMVAFAGWTAWQRLAPRAPAPAPALPETAHAAPLSTLPVKAPPVDATWIDAHFRAPVPAQGPAPAGWSAIEVDLRPEACGACHVAQYEDWKASWHALGMGPGVMGQLVDWDGVDDRTVQQCQSCHAPLAEQHPRLDGADNPLYQPELRDDGLTCAGCHVRGWTRLGPPKPDGTPPIEGAPHGGFVAREEFRDSRFCEPCHDFRPHQKALEGKLLQETWQEWARTDHAARGETCQSCHMPGGRHTWKGIHDPDMVKQAFTAALELDGHGDRLTGALRVTNTGAAHRLPTYTTPQLTLTVEQVDAAGQPLPGTRAEGAIARHLKPNLTVEYYDTRLLPGETHTVGYDHPRAPAAVAVRARVEVWPDEAYRRFYEIKLKNPDYGPKGRAQIEAALAASVASRFVAWEETRPLP